MRPSLPAFFRRIRRKARRCSGARIGDAGDAPLFAGCGNGGRRKAARFSQELGMTHRRQEVISRMNRQSGESHG